MSVRTLKTPLAAYLGSHALTTAVDGLPMITAGIWLSLSEQKHSESYTEKYLRSLNILYLHCGQISNDPMSLDRMVMKGDIDAILASLRSFVAERQNIAAITGTDQSQTVKLAISGIKDVMSEIRYRNNSAGFDSSKITRSLSKIDSLYRFLRPPRSTKRVTVRSLPEIVLNELFGLLRPDSETNPFRTQKLRERNFVLFALLYQMGLRRGELLTLTSNSMKSGYDNIEGKVLYWLDVRETDASDLRTTTPKLKNEYSSRQIPLPESLYHLLVNYVSNYRGRCSHGFLASSQRGLPLSQRALNDVCAKLTANLSVYAKSELLSRCDLHAVTPHNFRHSAAVDRIRSYRNAGIELGHAESLMRAFFGWSPSSKMPLLYAKAYYEEQVITTWSSEFDQRVKDMMGYGQTSSTLTCAPKLPPFSGRVFNTNGDSYEEITVQRRTDHCDIKRTREWLADEGCVPPARHQLGNILQVEG